MRIGSGASTPARFSSAFTALVWYATGQMPQMRAVMSGASVNERPRSSASKNRGGSKIRSSTCSTRPFSRRTVIAPSPSTRAR